MLLEVRDLTVNFSSEYGVAEVLDGVNFSINEGEVMGLVGESGCGKTTLARSILGVLPPAADVMGGEIILRGENLLQKTPDDLSSTFRGSIASFIPQDPYGSFNPVFTVGDQIMDVMKWKSPLLRKDNEFSGERMAPALFRRYPKVRHKADLHSVIQMLQDVQIPDPERALKKLPHEFSGGQRQRLMIAMALLTEPELIIADEPTTALDVITQAQILVLLRRMVKERNISVIFTTHDLATAYEFCDRISVMYAGQEVEVANTEDFFNHPAHPYTVRLLASIPGADRTFVGIPGEFPALIGPPNGCRFHPRCEFAADQCRKSRPPGEEIGDAHMLRCFYPVVQRTGAQSDAESPS
jgi:peptide/nickel transport system ATP-binding protein